MKYMKIQIGKLAKPLLAALFLCYSGSAGAQVAGTDTAWREARDHAIRHIINPEDYECEPTAFDYWIGGKVGEMGVINFYALVLSGALDWSTFYSLLLDNDASDDYIGVNGEYTKFLTKQHKDLQRFWDVPTKDVLLMGMHGAVLEDATKMVPSIMLYQALENDVIITQEEAEEMLALVQAVIEGGTQINLWPLLEPIVNPEDPQYEAKKALLENYTPAGIPGGFNHPLLTLNAFAFSAEGVDYLGNGNIIPDKIVMGEGILDALGDIGVLIGDPALVLDAPEFVHAHEFGHHVQFELGVFDDYDGTPEATRRTELMADSFGAYYCAHARGATFQAKRFADVLNAAAVVGDCQFDSPGHHGTPNQRERAAQWGGDLAKTKGKRGFIKSASVVRELFDGALETLIVPDPE
jgi:hypothetical protein